MTDSEQYWIEAARKPQIDPDQVASQNYTLPLPVHQRIRVQQIGFLEEQMSRLSPPIRVLDLGCGPGIWGLKLAHRVQSWLGYDISPDFIAHARQVAQDNQLHHLDFRVGSMMNVDPGSRFNLIVLGGTLGYVQDAELGDLMLRVKQLLEPDGLVYVRVSVIPGIYPRITFKRGYPIHYRKVHHYDQIFRSLGFQIQHDRDLAFTEASLATAYTFLARWWGRTGMTAYRWADFLRPLSFGLARRLVDLTPLPQSMQFVLSH